MSICTPNKHEPRCSGRHSCSLLMKCLECGWTGPLYRTYHGYRPTGERDEVEPGDWCCDCGGEIEYAGVIELRSVTNVRKHRQDICKALDIPFAEDMLADSYFVGRFPGKKTNFLDAQGLLNRGFCPICGIEPIGTEYKRELAHSKTVEYLCGECHKLVVTRTTKSGGASRYDIKLGCWMIFLAVLVGLLLLRACE